MTEQQSPQGGALPAWARLAQPIALAAWVLAALAPGVAVALAQYTSLAYGLHSPLYTVALLIVCLGSGPQLLLGWVFWIGGCGSACGEPGIASGRALAAACCSARSRWRIVAGGVLASVGENGDSVALPALFALGLGVSGVAGGVLGAVWSAGRFIAQSARASQAVETLVDLVGPPRHGGGLHCTLYQPAVRIAAYFPAPPLRRRRFAACAGGRHWTGLRVVPRAAHRIREPRQARARVRAVDAMRSWVRLPLLPCSSSWELRSILACGFSSFIPILACIILPPILRKRSGLSAF